MKAFPFSLLNSDELCTSTERINHITEEIGANDPFIGQVRQLMAESSQALSNAIGSSRSSDFTGRLLESDGQRDSAFIGLRDYAKAFANHRDPEKAGAGKKLVDLIQQRGWSLYRQGYMVETSQLNALIADLESESYTPAIQLVGAETWLTDLKETQNAFELLYQEKVDTESGEEYPPGAGIKKKSRGLSFLAVELH